MHIKSEGQRNLSAEVGLRPDTDIMMVTIEKSKLFKISRWNGFMYKDKVGWDGPGKPIPADVAEQQSMNLLGQKLSVAVFHVNINNFYKTLISFLKTKIVHLFGGPSFFREESLRMAVSQVW